MPVPPVRGGSLGCVIVPSAWPEAVEAISYQIPTFTLHGTYLIYFAGFKKHVSVYPAPVGSAELAEEMSICGSGKGTAKFPLHRPIPPSGSSATPAGPVPANITAAI